MFSAMSIFLMTSSNRMFWPVYYTSGDAQLLSRALCSIQPREQITSFLHQELRSISTDILAPLRSHESRCGKDVCLLRHIDVPCVEPRCAGLWIARPTAAAQQSTRELLPMVSYTSSKVCCFCEGLGGVLTKLWLIGRRYASVMVAKHIGRSPARRRSVDMTTRLRMVSLRPHIHLTTSTKKRGCTSEQTKCSIRPQWRDANLACPNADD